VTARTSAAALDTEVLIIGSGAGGATTAAKLAAAGRTVMVVEEGPWIEPDAVEPFSLEEMRAKYRHHGPAAALGSPPVAYAEGRCVGGSTEINSGLWHRLPDELAEEWRIRYQIEVRLEAAGHPPYPGTWAIFVGTWIRTGLDLGSVDPDDELSKVGTRPLLFTHGTADDEDLPERTQAFVDRAGAMGIPTELHWCAGSGHDALAGMPVDVCKADFARWVSDFFTRTLT
jgi:choline dehydrogenase-like flavoprotein